jgi:hypothetical protein
LYAGNPENSVTKTKDLSDLHDVEYIMGYVTTFSFKIVVLMMVTQPVVFVTVPDVAGRGKIQVSGAEPLPIKTVKSIRKQAGI